MAEPVERRAAPAQRRDPASDRSVQRHPLLERRAADQSAPDYGAMLRARPAGPQPLQRAAAPNRTGLPDRLKGGVEALSGVSLDEVKVHYGSPRPAELGAHAFAQGNEIHLAAGQERHLPHEAWHVAQQAQGRVKPTMQAMGGVSVNDDAGLEREADAMGTKALGGAAPRKGPKDEEVLQGRFEPGPARVPAPAAAGAAVVQLVKVGEAGAGVVFLAQTKFVPNSLYDTAHALLTEMENAATDYTDVDAIVAAVDADQRMIDARAAAQAAAQAAAAAALAAAQAAQARAASALLQDRGHGVQLRQYDVDNGHWEPIPDREDHYQLRTTILGVEYCYHVHPPRFEGGDPVSGQVMRAGRMTNTQTPVAVARVFIATHGRPEGW